MNNPQRLLGVGLYSPSEAERLIGVRRAKLVRWLRGHDLRDRHYVGLWSPQVDLGDGRVYLGFHDLMEARVADAFVRRGLSPQKVRRAIDLARDLVGAERPLSTHRFRTDGRSVFLQMAREDGTDELIDLFQRQYAFKEIVAPSLTNVDFDHEGIPSRWWPNGKSAGIVLDPTRSFGQPIESETSIPVAALAAAAETEGSVEAAARAWAVPAASVRRAVRFTTAAGDHRLAA